MKEQIRAILQSSWSSIYSGIDIDKATDAVYEFINQKIDAVTDSCEIQLSAMEGQIIDLKFDNAQLTKDAETFETDMEASDSLLKDCLPELNRLLEIQSNNPNKYRELNQLMYRVEEQIIRNAK